MENNEALNVKFVSDEDLEKVAGGWDGPYFVYIVKHGDCLSVIAKKYRTTEETIIALNNLTDQNSIYPGQKLMIPYC